MQPLTSRLRALALRGLGGLGRRHIEHRAAAVAEAGVVGTGRIGTRVARALRLGLGCEVLASDPLVVPELVDMGVRYLPRDRLLAPEVEAG